MEGGPRMGVALSLCWTKKKVPLEREEGGEVWGGGMGGEGGERG